MLVAVLGPLAAVSMLGFALGAADPTLEHITPRHWRRWRAAELSVCALAAAIALVLSLAPDDDNATEALRNLAGLGGLAALGVVALGARLAWLAPTAYAFAGAALGPRTEGWLMPLTWPVQSGDTGLAFAASLALAGAVLHVWCGAGALVGRR